MLATSPNAHVLHEACGPTQLPIANCRVATGSCLRELNAHEHTRNACHNINKNNSNITWSEQYVWDISIHHVRCKRTTSGLTNADWKLPRTDGINLSTTSCPASAVFCAFCQRNPFGFYLKLCLQTFWIVCSSIQGSWIQIIIPMQSELSQS